MKCMTTDCQDDAVIYVVEIWDRRILPQKPLCERHAGTHMPFCDPSGGKISVGTGLSGGPSRCEVRFVVFFDTQFADGLYLQEVGGSKRFSITVPRDSARSILLTVEKGQGPRVFTFPAFGKIIDSLGGKVEEVVVEDIDPLENYLHVKVKLRQGKRLVDVNVEPSDAFALAMACAAPIFIADRVFSRAIELGWA